MTEPRETYAVQGRMTIEEVRQELNFILQRITDRLYFVFEGDTEPTESQFLFWIDTS